MKYRGSTFHQRFYYETANDYDANDRDQLLEYMWKKGFGRRCATHQPAALHCDMAYGYWRQVDRSEALARLHPGNLGVFLELL